MCFSNFRKIPYITPKPQWGYDEKPTKILNGCIPTASCKNMTEYCSEKASQSVSIAQNVLEFTQRWVTLRGQITLTPTEFRETK